MSVGRILERELGIRLKSDATLQSLFEGDVPIFTKPSETNQLPYLVYSEIKNEDWSTDNTRGSIHTVAIECRTGSESEALLKDILDAVRDSIDRCNRLVDLSPFTLVTIDFDFQDIAMDADGQVYRGTAQYRALTGGRL